jgi:hypothetical protein
VTVAVNLEKEQWEETDGVAVVKVESRKLVSSYEKSPVFIRSRHLPRTVKLTIVAMSFA